MSDEDLRALVERGAGLTNRYVTAGPGTPAGVPHLEAAIDAFEEAYRRLEPDHGLRGQVAGQLGWLYGIRHLAHQGDPGDRTKGIHLLDESLQFPNLPPVLEGGNRIVLGQLLLAGASGGMRSPDAVMRMMQGGGSADLSDVDRAIAEFRKVIEGPPISADLTATAQTLLTVAEALRGMLGGAGGLDFGRMGQAFAAMQNFQQRAGGGVVPPPMPDLSAFTHTIPPQPTSAPPPQPTTTAPPPATTTTTAPPPATTAPPQAAAIPAQPRGRREAGPVAVIDGPAPEEGPLPRRRPAPEPVPTAAALRTQLAQHLPAGGLGALLERDADPSAVDDRVAMAAALAEADGAGPADLLALAVTLIARHDADGGSGWSDGLDDLRAAADTLNRAAPDVPSLSAADVRLAVAVAERLDAALPGTVRLSDHFADVAVALREGGIDFLVYPGPVVLEATTGHLHSAPPDTRWTGRIAATDPIDTDATVSYVSTATQLAQLIRRGRRPVAEAAVFVSNPRRDRESATMDALGLRRAFYPLSTGLGWTVEQTDGPGTPDEVRGRLDASLLHLGCGVTPDGDLELAGPAVLTLTAIAGAPVKGGTAVLPPDPAALQLAEALLTCGYTAVIGFTSPVPDQVASLVYWMLHSALVDDGADPPAAVATVRAWLRDPERAVPELLAAAYRATADRVDPAYAQALICRGR